MHGVARLRALAAHSRRSMQAAASSSNSSSSLASIVAALPSCPPAAASLFHSCASLSAAPKPAGGKPAAAAAGGASPLASPPAEGSARWVKEGWGSPRLVPIVTPTAKAGTDADAAEAEAARILPLLHAEVREQVGSKYARHLRKQRLRIPGIVCDRQNPRRNQLLISLDRFELEQLCRTYRRSVGHRVCLLHVEGQAQPFKVIPDEFKRHPVTQELLVANFFLFKPNQEKVRVNVPIVYTGAEDCVGVKRGGVLVVLRDSVPCVWTGDEHIPPFIHLDLTTAEGGKVFRNQDLILPPQLRLFDPKYDYVLATVLGAGTKGRADEVEEVVATAVATPQQPSAIQLEKEKKEKERREEEEMVAQKLAQKKGKK